MQPSADTFPYSDFSIEDRFNTSLYSYGALYEAAGGAVDARAIGRFVTRLCLHHIGQPNLKSGLELGCSTAALSRYFARQGIFMSAVDISAESIEAGAQAANRENIDLDLYHANMIDFRLDRPVDFAVNLGLNTEYILTHEEMLTHLHAVADNLVPGGTFVIDFSFLVYKEYTQIIEHQPPWIVFKKGPGYVQDGEVDGTVFRFEFGGGVVKYDPFRQLLRSTDRLYLHNNGQSQEIVSESVSKVTLPLEFKALVAQTHRFDFVDWYSTYHVNFPLEQDPETDRYIVVLRKKQ